jgi:hypothetical protein
MVTFILPLLGSEIFLHALLIMQNFMEYTSFSIRK